MSRPKIQRTVAWVFWGGGGRGCFFFFLKRILRTHWIIFYLKSNKKWPGSGNKYFQPSVNILVGLQHWNKLALQILWILQVVESCIWYLKFSVVFAQLFECAVALFTLFASTAFPTKIPIFSACWLLKYLWLEVEIPYLAVLQLVQQDHKSDELLKGKILPLDGAIVMLFNLRSVIMWMAWNLHPCPPQGFCWDLLQENPMYTGHSTDGKIVILKLYLHKGWARVILSGVICIWALQMNV